MKHRMNLIPGGVCSALAGLLLALLSVQIFAQSSSTPFKSTAASLWSTEFEGEAAFLGTGSVKRGNDKFFGNSEISSSSSLVFTRQISDSLQLRIGAEYQIYSYDTKSPTPIPDVIQGANLVVGANFNIGQAILVRIDAKPGFYGEFSHLSLKSFNVPFQIGGTYFISSDLQLALGVEVNLNRRIPVFPGAGIRWKISDKWLLNGILPRPQLEYTYNDKLMLHLGADLGGSTFRVSEDFGSDRGIKKLDNAILDYEEIRAGGGVVWQVSNALKVDIEAGCVPYRRFDYYRADYKLLSDDIVPYARIGISAEF
jgi:Domain of unknown function (DUF6268)